MESSGKNWGQGVGCIYFVGRFRTISLFPFRMTVVCMVSWQLKSDIEADLVRNEKKGLQGFLESERKHAQHMSLATKCM